MIGKSGNADVYTDFNGLAKLKTQARAHSPEAVKETAKQFESLFLQMAMKNMRSASPESGLIDNQKTQFARDLYDQQLAVELGKHSSLGVADQLTRQLSGQSQGSGPVGKSLADYRTNAFPRTFEELGLRPADAGSDAPAPTLPFTLEAGAAPGTPTPTPSHERFQSRQAFIDAVWPHAKAAGEELGVDPKLLLAQAALESGWGKALQQDGHGMPTHNLFGIKADKSWTGNRVAVKTLEFEHGIPVRKRAAFRAYDSYADSFKDYVNFLRRNPRYATALENADNPRQFARSLQQAGYATDPAYARKIMAIYRHASRTLTASTANA